MRVIIFRDVAGQWRWRLVAANNQVVATAGEGFTRKWSARRAARRALKMGAGLTD